MVEYFNKNLAWHYIKLAMPSSERENLKKAFDKIPIADVQEVKHGKWFCNNGFFLGEKPFYCSLCGEDSNERKKFCPECGAKMDGKD